MKSKSLQLFAFALLLISLTYKHEVYAQASPTWEEDLDYLVKELSTNHPGLYDKISQEQFMAEVDYLKKASNTLSEAEMILLLQKLLASVGDAHTTLVSNKEVAMNFHFLPVRGYWFSDGFYLTSVIKGNEDLLGKKLVRIGNSTVEETFEKIKPFISHENDQWVKKIGAQFLLTPELLKFAGVIDSVGSVDLELEGIGVRRVHSYDLMYIGTHPWASFYEMNNITPPLYNSNFSNYWYKYLEPEHLLYVQYNKCEDIQGKPFADFCNNLFDFISNNPVDKLVIDLRNNSGGNSEVFKPFLEKIKNHELNSQGKLFTIVGRSTFSSAMINAFELKNETNALFFGEPTGGQPCSYGEIVTLKLPGKGYMLTYSTRHFTIGDCSQRSFYPENQVEISFSSYSSGVDPVLDKIIQY